MSIDMTVVTMNTTPMEKTMAVMGTVYFFISFSNASSHGVVWLAVTVQEGTQISFGHVTADPFAEYVEPFAVVIKQNALAMPCGMAVSLV